MARWIIFGCLFLTTVLALGCLGQKADIGSIMNATTEGQSERIIGGDKDAHGCLIGAGYSWCPSTEKCQRMWEEYCAEYAEQYRGNETVTDNTPVANATIANDTPAVATFTANDVAKHSTQNDCWMIINGQVYDLTDYISSHPGGDAMLQACGGDGTTLFNTNPRHSSYANDLLLQYNIGVVI
jgi:cytochrome b involved in lipid metabolism